MNAQLRRRRQAFSASLGDLPLDVLEVGALASPMFRDQERVSYLDWFSREELEASLASNERYANANFVSPTYVAKTTRFSKVVDASFDLVIANHVLEHVPDPITWLQQVHHLTKSGGHLFMALPDRRFTFDFLRPESTMAEVQRAYHAQLETPDFEQVLEARYLHRGVRHQDFVDGLPTEKLLAGRFSLAEAVDIARGAEGRYVDVHCHVFTYQSFLALLADLEQEKLIDWNLVFSQDVQAGSNEFMVVLQKP